MEMSMEAPAAFTPSVSRDHRPFLLPEMFSGDERYEDWIVIFESVAAINSWSDSEKVLWLRIALKGKAHVAYNRLSHETRESYKASISALRNRFEPFSKRELYKINFERRTKHGEESWADFGDDLVVLADRAYPDWQPEARELLALDRYLDQLFPQQISFHVRQRRPKTIDEAVAATVEFQFLLLSIHSNQGLCDLDVSNQEELKRPVNTSKDSIMEMLQKLTDRLGKLEVAAAGPLNPEDWGAETERTTTNVNQYAGGNIFTDQTQHPNQPQLSETKPSSTNSGDYRQHKCACTTISINSVSSYYLSGNVSISPVAFLVDTGAGVSLMCQTVWDKVKPADCKLDAKVAHNLVSVDGNPIKINGSAVIPFSIAGLSFQQEFIIAEQITADAILGVNFLESNKCVLNLANKEMSVGHHGVLPLATNPCHTTQSPVKVTIVNTLEIPATSELKILARIHTTSAGGTWLVEGEKQSSVLVARAAVMPYNGLIPIRIINTSLVPTTLHKGTKLAMAESIDEVSISAVQEFLLDQPTNSPNLTLHTPLPDELSQDQRDTFMALLARYSDILVSHAEDLGVTDVLSHHNY